SFSVSTPCATAVVACCATSCATRFTRANGERDDFFLMTVFLTTTVFFDAALRADPRLATTLFADFFADFADAERQPRALDPPRFLPTGFFPRDFLARVAMMLLLGVGSRRHAA